MSSDDYVGKISLSSADTGARQCQRYWQQRCIGGASSSLSCMLSRGRLGQLAGGQYLPRRASSTAPSRHVCPRRSSDRPACLHRRGFDVDGLRRRRTQACRRSEASAGGLLRLRLWISWAAAAGCWRHGEATAAFLRRSTLALNMLSSPAITEGAGLHRRRCILAAA